MGTYRPERGKHELKIVEIRDTGKTKVWQVKSTFEYSDDEIIVGIIKWHGAWRKYAFFPQSDTLFDVSCMTKICNFITGHMEARKKAR